ncbi:hypothetical protein OAK38_08910 [Verrucomicrobia bacterium]|nr:hypothetical protein [Verrucomicrobiota bacterium]
MKAIILSIFLALFMLGCAESTTSASALRLKYHQRLLDDGIITEEQFSALANQEQSPQALEARALIKEYQEKHEEE